jgi:hypothetical protein
MAFIPRSAATKATDPGCSRRRGERIRSERHNAFLQVIGWPSRGKSAKITDHISGQLLPRPDAREVYMATGCAPFRQRR